MMGDDIERRVIGCVADALVGDRALVTPGDSLLDDLGADEDEILDLMLNIEIEFGIFVADSALDDLRTVGDWVRYVEEQTRGGY